MQSGPRRLAPKRFTMFQGLPDGALDTGFPMPPNLDRRLSRKLRVVRRAMLVLLWTLLAIPAQALFLLVPGRPKVWFARVYWAGVCALIGLRVRTLGRPARGGGDGARPVIFTANHSSWLDILVLGGRVEGCFISKAEIARWPVVNVIARLGRTVFVARKRNTAGRERDDMHLRLSQGDNLVLFPEGTSSDGSRVLPFRSAFFSLAEQAVTADGLPPLIQPVSVVYDRIGYLPTGKESRALFAWYGDMDLARHFWRLAQYRGLRVTVLLHAPLEPRAFADRKALAQAAWHAVADGAATLRQNRPARPIGAEGPVGVIGGGAQAVA